jgi:hypothetical protein
METTFSEFIKIIICVIFVPTIPAVLLFYLFYKYQVLKRRQIERQYDLLTFVSNYILELFTPKILDLRDERLALFCKKTEELDKYLLAKGKLGDYFEIKILLEDYFSVERPLWKAYVKEMEEKKFRKEKYIIALDDAKMRCRVDKYNKYKSNKICAKDYGEVVLGKKAFFAKKKMGVYIFPRRRLRTTKTSNAEN